MLVLTRKPGQRIRIGGDVSVTVVRVGAGGVRLGIEAPPGVAVHRGELRLRIEAGAAPARGVPGSIPPCPPGRDGGTLA